MPDLINFCVFTRGRTGSTAIVDNLNDHSKLICHQELFRQELKGSPFYESVVAFQRYIQDTDAPSVENYFRLLHTDADDGIAGLGCKILSQHIEENQSYDLWKFLRHSDFKFVFLLRNPLRVSISGHIAGARSFYNLRRDCAHYKELKEKVRNVEIDAQKVLSDAGITAMWDQKWLKILQDEGVNFKIAYYEDYVLDRMKFMNDIAAFIGVDSFEDAFLDNIEKVTPSNVWDCIENAEEVRAVIKAAGYDPDNERYDIHDPVFQKVAAEQSYTPSLLARLKRKLFRAA